MISKFKNTKKYYYKLLKKYSIFNNDKTIKTITILYDSRDISIDNYRSMIKKVLNIPSDKINTIGYRNYVKKDTVDDNFFSKKDFNWFGRLKSNNLKKLVQNSDDMLINLCYKNNMYINIVNLLSKAKFKVGFFNKKNTTLNLMIDVKHDDYKAFNFEINKYLQILKKI